MFHPRHIVMLALSVLAPIGVAVAAEPVGEFLERHCLECHAGDKPKGDFRLDQLPRDFTEEAHQERWLTALERVRAGEMPPEKKPRPAEAEVRTLSDWVEARVK